MLAPAACSSQQYAAVLLNSVNQSTVCNRGSRQHAELFHRRQTKSFQCPPGTEVAATHCEIIDHDFLKEAFMGRGILLWLLGIPIPIIILIMLFVR
jgi:hypothetical protein